MAEAYKDEGKVTSQCVKSPKEWGQKASFHCGARWVVELILFILFESFVFGMVYFQFYVFNLTMYVIHMWSNFLSSICVLSFDYHVIILRKLLNFIFKVYAFRYILFTLNEYHFN